MKITRNIVCTAAIGCALAFGLSACGDSDSGTSSSGKSEYDYVWKSQSDFIRCTESLNGKKAYYTPDDLVLVCEYDESVEDWEWVDHAEIEPKSSASEDLSCSSKIVESSASDDEVSSSSESEDSSSSNSAESSSSEDTCVEYIPEEALPEDPAAAEPQYVVTEVCEDVGACDAMDKNDVSTWHFVREDNFGDDMEYTYSIDADGKTLVLTTVDSEGAKKEDRTSYSFYDMSKEISVTMAFGAVKSTCEDGNGNKNKAKACTKDSVLVEDSAVQWSPENVDADSKYDAAANTLTDLRDNKVYKTAKIGEQVWMAENLNYAYLNQTSEGESGLLAPLDSSSFCYNNNPKNCEKMGRLYLWSAAMDSAAVFSDAGRYCGKYEDFRDGKENSKRCKPEGAVRGVCPKGWHLPSKDEFIELFATVDKTTEEGYNYNVEVAYMLKSVCGWKEHGEMGIDKYGFAALPAGERPFNGGYNGAGANASFWTSSKYDDDTYPNLNSLTAAYDAGFMYNYKSAYLTKTFRSSAISVRCVMD